MHEYRIKRTSSNNWLRSNMQTKSIVTGLCLFIIDLCCPYILKGLNPYLSDFCFHSILRVHCVTGTAFSFFWKSRMHWHWISILFWILTMPFLHGLILFFTCTLFSKGKKYLRMRYNTSNHFHFGWGFELRCMQVLNARSLQNSGMSRRLTPVLEWTTTEHNGMLT